MAAVVISEFMDEDAIHRHLGGLDVLYDPALVDKPDALSAALANARALIVRNRTQVRAALLAAGPRLEAIGRLGVGLDNIEVAACRARGVAVYPATGANNLSVAEYVIAAALVLRRGAYAATAEVIAGQWPRTRLMGREVAGARLGLVGYGAIAREVARRALAMGMIVAAHDPHVGRSDAAWRTPWGEVTPASLGDLLADSDIVSLHVPLTAETSNLLDRAALKRMKRDAILINAARGGVIDEGALAQALKAGALGGAALDVFCEEPLTASRAGIFEGCPNLILTPHIAGVTVESNVRVSNLVAKKIRDHLQGKE
ncbi:MAG: hydroxyacid dehydrogenase [Hyphomonadaceae bacterium]|nr:hydroxyacid dehydrogenase [Hyphomonadaceae bacterium]